MQTRAVVFDKDGTLLDFEALWVPVAAAVTQKLFLQYNIKNVPTEEILAAWGIAGEFVSIKGSICYGTYADMARDCAAVLQRYGCNIPPAELAAWLSTAFLECMPAGKLRPTCPELPEILRQLKQAGIVVALMTADAPDITKKCLQGLGILEYFDILYTDDGTHPPKPDPYCIHRLCEAYGFTKDQVVMVGDTLTDMQFAKNAGVRGIGLAKTIENKAILFSLTDTVLYDLTYLQAEL